MFGSAAMKPARAVRLLAAWLVCLISLPAAGAEEAFDAFDAKTAILSKLPEFVEWPSAAEAPDSTFHLCLLVEGDVSRALAYYAGRTVKGLPVDVKRLSPDADDAGCQLLYVSSAYEEALIDGLEQLSGRGILAVGESETFLSRGGVLSLIVEAERVVVVANVGAAARHGFTLDSSLLAMARLHEGSQP